MAPVASGKVGRAGEGGEERQVAADESTLRTARDDCMGPVLAHRERVVPHPRIPHQRRLGVEHHSPHLPGRELGPGRNSIRSVKADEVRPRVQRVQEGGDVAVPEHHLRVPGDGVEVHVGQRPGRAPAASQSDHPADLVIGEGRVDVGRPVAIAVRPGNRTSPGHDRRLAPGARAPRGSPPRPAPCRGRKSPLPERPVPRGRLGAAAPDGWGRRCPGRAECRRRPPSPAPRCPPPHPPEAVCA